MNIDFSKKTVLVTGASRGIGRVIATKFADANATVVVHYNKNKQKAEETLASLKKGNHFIAQADMADPDSI
ncbi:MAG: SDR family NAD(P)-dependent oxidoreductase, partial [Candidatus Aminicenantes bacterium]|nr:SDR family NAD(P)-dependent oxidoreductase [Candidatus Aminicenantes bacterium]